MEALTVSSALTDLAQRERKVLDDLLEMLQSSDPAYRERARDILWSVGSAAVPALLKLVQHNDSNVRLSAVLAINASDSDTSTLNTVVSVLVIALNDADASIRAAAADGLWKIAYRSELVDWVREEAAADAWFAGSKMIIGARKPDDPLYHQDVMKH